MRKTKKLLALAIAVVMMMSLFSFLGLNSSAAPVNLALNTQMNAAGDNPASFPRTIAPLLYRSTVTFYRLLNGNIDINDTNQRITFGTNATQLAAFQAAYREMQGNPEADWFATNNRPGLWVGVDFGTPQRFNQLVVYQTALPDARGILGTFVIEVANYDDLAPYWVPDSFLYEDGRLQNPNRAAPLGSFNQNGWTVASDVITANTTLDGFTPGPITVNLTHTGEFRYVRIRTITNIMPPNSTNDQGLPMLTSLQVFQQPGGANQPGTGDNNQQQAFVPVTRASIPTFDTNIRVGNTVTLPQTTTVGTNRNITWSIVGTTDAATLNAATRVLTAHAENTGTFTLRATVANGATETTPFYTDFTITISKDGTTPPAGEPGVIIAGLSIAAIAMASIAVLAKKTAATEV
ncbi:MAG: hypothetical protein FWB93_04435 [Oscillospiraceae bacterium]|nr:hypothetical protein [Oscillospiraceae bacterium]